jgi:G3E family GTPase
MAADVGVEPAGVICAVDAAAGRSILDRREEARSQVECAERVLLTKLDIATPADALAVHERLDALGAVAERASFPANRLKLSLS